MARSTPNKNRSSILNLAGTIARLTKTVFAKNNKSTPENTDTISIQDANGDPFYVTISQLSSILSSGQLASYLSTNLPSASPAGQVIYISDLGVMAYSNGSNWIS